MAILRNDFREPRICPTLGFHEVAPNGTITVPDDELEHWIAGGWTPADPATVKAAKAAAAARAAAFEALTYTGTAAADTTAVAPAKPAKDTAPTPEDKTP